MGTSKGKVIGYVRVSTGKQDAEKQRLAIHEWAQRDEVKITDIISATISSRKSQEARRLDELRELVAEGDTIVCAELSRLGRSISEILRLADEFRRSGVRLVFLKENLDLHPKNERDLNSKIMLTLLGLFAEIERDLISERTKDALYARKKAGVKLGRPKGRSKLDGKENRIKELLELEVPRRRIAQEVGCSTVTLSNWLKKRKI